MSALPEGLVLMAQALGVMGAAALVTLFLCEIFGAFVYPVRIRRRRR